MEEEATEQGKRQGGRRARIVLDGGGGIGGLLMFGGALVAAALGAAFTARALKRRRPVDNKERATSINITTAEETPPPSASSENNSTRQIDDYIDLSSPIAQEEDQTEMEPPHVPRDSNLPIRMTIDDQVDDGSTVNEPTNEETALSSEPPIGRDGIADEPEAADEENEAEEDDEDADGDYDEGSVQEDDESGQVSDSTLDSSMESNAELVWPAEATESSSSSSVEEEYGMKSRFDIKRDSVDGEGNRKEMVSEQTKIFLKEDPMGNSATAGLARKGTGTVIASKSKVFLQLASAMLLAMVLVFLGHHHDRVIETCHHLYDVLYRSTTDI